MTGDFVLTLSCPDRVGIVHGVAGLLAHHGANIADSQQFCDPASETFFMRVQISAEVSASTLRAVFCPVAERFGMEWELHDITDRPRVLVLPLARAIVSTTCCIASAVALCAGTWWRWLPTTPTLPT